MPKEGKTKKKSGYQNRVAKQRERLEAEGRRSLVKITDLFSQSSSTPTSAKSDTAGPSLAIGETERELTETGDDGTTPLSECVEQSKDEDICADLENKIEIETEAAVFKIGTCSSSTGRQDIRTSEENTAGASINTEPHTSNTNTFISDDDNETEITRDTTMDCDIGADVIGSINYFIKPKQQEFLDVKLCFYKKHPIQPRPLGGEEFPFNPEKLYYKKLSNNVAVQRKWLSYSTELNKVFCINCMVFGPTNAVSPFANDGYLVNVKHIYDAVKTHEGSKEHKNATTAAFQSVTEAKGIDDLINRDLRNKHLGEVDRRRKIRSRIIDIILFLAKQGLAFQGHAFEGAYDLYNYKVKNRGNFLEMVLLLAKYDTLLLDHIDKCQILSQERKEKHQSSKGRGSLVTFLSKASVNKLIQIIGNKMQNLIADDIRKSGKFGLMVDSTTDISVVDQQAISFRYVKDGFRICERVLDFVAVHDASGDGLYKLIKKSFDRFNLDISNISACSFDGAANMKGEFNGLKTKIIESNPNAMYTHCMGHVLNLVMSDTISTCEEVDNFFGLVQESAVFLHDSYKRMNIWKELTKSELQGRNQLRKLRKIGATRWWSKDAALTSVFELPDKIMDIKKSRYVIFLKFLLEVIDSKKSDSKTKFSARTLIQNWCKFTSILTALTLLNIFSVSTPASKYLQSSELDYLKAWSIVDIFTKKVKEKRNDQHFSKLYEDAKKLASDFNEVFEEKEMKIEIEEDFPVKRRSVKKRMAGERYVDEVWNLDATAHYRINTYNVIFDEAWNSIEERFVPNKDLLQDCSWFDTKRFNDIKNFKSLDEFPNEVFLYLSRVTGLNRISLLEELKQFAENYDSLTINWRNTYKKLKEKRDKEQKNKEGSSVNQGADYDNADDRECDDEVNFSTARRHNNEQNCAECLPCLLLLLYELTTMSNLFNNLYLAVTFILTIPVTQVNCERAFNKLKKLKTHARNSLGQINLTPLIMIYLESDLVSQLNINEVIDEFGNSSSELKKLLF